LGVRQGFYGARSSSRIGSQQGSKIGHRRGEW
jgi:hypothetical protein